MACAGPCNDPSRHQIATHGGSRRDDQLHPIQLLGEDLQNQRELLEGAGTLACLPTLRRRVQELFNNRPRKVLGYRTPSEAFRAG